MLLSLGAWLGAVVGRALRRGAKAVKLGVLDRILGAIGNLLVTAFVVALVASGVAAMGVPVLSPAVAGSRVLTTLDAVTPSPARSLLAEIRVAALGDGIPWLVEVLDGPRVAPELPTGGVDDAELARAAASVVRITGSAFECGSNLSGSGFVVAPDRIVTNAHVVAGRRRSRSSRHPASPRSQGGSSPSIPTRTWRSSPCRASRRRRSRSRTSWRARTSPSPGIRSADRWNCARRA